MARRTPTIRSGKLGGLGQWSPGLPDPEPAARGLQPPAVARRGRRGHRRQILDLAAAGAAASSPARRQAARRVPVQRSTRCSRSGAGPRRALACRLSELLTRGQREASRVERSRCSRRRLHDAPAGRDRRLHRLLCRHPPRDQCRQAVPPRQPAAAELQVRADRLSRPRVVDPSLGHAGAPPEGPAQARTSRPELRPQPQARLRAGARGLDRPGQRARRADPDRGGAQHTSPASAC